MKKRILIISSEQLRPSNILASTFELTQATILAEYFDVSILSVTIQNSFSSTLKTLFKKVVSRTVYKNHFTEVVQTFKVCFLGHKIVNKYVIEGIEVYEGIGYHIISPKSFLKFVSSWVKVGFTTYLRYCKELSTPDIIHAHGRFLLAGALAMKIKKKEGIKYIYTEHSTYFQRGLVPIDAISIINAVIDNASIYIAVSESLLRNVEKTIKRDIKNPLIVPNVLDKVFERNIPGVQVRKDFRFLVIGSLDEKKGIDLLIKSFHFAFCEDTNIKLVICGDGIMKSEIIKMISQYDLQERVLLSGFKSKNQIVELIDECDAFVLPSRVETFGVVVIEALSRGKPVLATISGGPEYIINDECGLLVEVGSVEQLTEGLRKLFATIDKYNSNVIREYALENFGSQKFLKTIIKLYESLK